MGNTGSRSVFAAMVPALSLREIALRSSAVDLGGARIITNRTG